jgi:hypothetical protein
VRQPLPRDGDLEPGNELEAHARRRQLHRSVDSSGGGYQSTYHLDYGRALAYLGRDDEALRHLIEAERLAPAHVRADPLVWETVQDIVERRQRKAVAPEVRAFCGRLGVAL